MLFRVLEFFLKQKRITVMIMIVVTAIAREEIIITTIQIMMIVTTVAVAEIITEVTAVGKNFFCRNIFFRR